MQEYERCVQCGGPIQRRKHELVCMECGLVQGEAVSMVHRLPMDVTYQPTNLLVFGKGLGDTLDHNGLLRVLAKAPNGTKDLGLRARFIRILTQMVEPPPLKKALEHASKTLSLLKFDQDHLVSNDVGALIRKCFAWAFLTRQQISQKQLAHAAIFYVLNRKYGLTPVPAPTRQNGYIKTQALLFMEKYLKLCEFIDKQTTSFT
ncbi:MAG: hypothetical protein QXR76_03305 [Candidatus Bathyarchaeia archaeon]